MFLHDADTHNFSLFDFFSNSVHFEPLEQTDGEWAESYTNDMMALRFDSLQTMICKVQHYSRLSLFEAKESDTISILDVGCGTGLLGEYLLKHCGDEDSRGTAELVIDGMDVTKEMLDVLQRERSPMYNDIYQHDIENTPWPCASKTYDISVCNGVLVYVQDGGRCLDEFARVTKSGGHCLLMLRQDSLDEFSTKIYKMMTDGIWRLADITETRFNFQAEIQEKRENYVPYNHHIFQVL